MIKFSHGRMRKRRTSTSGLPLLVFLTETLFVVAASEQCEVKNIIATSETNSTFVYNFIYKNSSCSNKGELDVRLKSCDGISDYFSYDTKDEGNIKACIVKGRWKVTVDQGLASHVESNCFNCSFGKYRDSNIYLRFNSRELRIEIKDVHPLVSNWSLTIYKTTKTSDYLICDGYTRKKIKRLFQNTGLQPKISLKKITLQHDFEDACYCFLMEPISNMILQPPYDMFTTTNCKPTPIIYENRGPSVPDVPMSSRAWLMLMVLLGIVILVSIAVKLIISRPQFLSKLLGLRRLIGHIDTYQEKMFRGSEVLLLHAPDVSSSEHMLKLKKQLQKNFKVHDLLDHNDYKRLADPCGWVQEMLMPGSGVMLLLVESVGLMDLINSLLQQYPENHGMVNPTQTSCSLLTFVLRTIICTDLREDYSTVFVVRFSDEVEDVADLVVQMRRYKFPDHFLKLEDAMKKARCSSERKEVV